MIKATELRIGNWVDHKDLWSYRQPRQDFKEFDFQWNEADWYALGKCTLDLEIIQPIPLTEEWLLKFGFERRPWGLIKGGLLFRDNIKNPCEELTLQIGNGFNVTVQHVHTLQNLYFALTGEELILKEKI